MPIYDSVWTGDMGPHGGTSFHTLTDVTENIPKAEWDARRVGQICTTADTFADWKGSIEKLCSLTKRCIYIREMNKFFQKVQDTSKKARAKSP